MTTLNEQEPLLQLTWTDPDSGTRGYCVIDRLVGDIATGGTRMRVGCTLSEVRDLARGMSAKTGVFVLPVGGAKAGIDYDPHNPKAREVLARFVQAVRPILDDYWVTAEDLGVPQTVLDEVFDEAGLGMSLHAALVRSPDPDATLARVRRSFAAEIDGVAVPDLVGGYGVAEAAVAALRHVGRDPSDCRAVVQGFGSMGGSSARYLANHGVRVVGVADRHGVIVNDEGLDVEALLKARSIHGDVDRSVLRADDRELPGPEWLTLDVDVLVPAAVSYAIDENNCTSVRAPLIVEAANVPTTPDAEHRLFDRGVLVIPDFVANGGAAAWAWWTLFGDVSDEPADAFAKLAADMSAIVGQIMAVRDETGVSPRVAALAISQRNHDRLEAEHAAGRPRRRIQ